ncbi:hypothetical protein CALVIDRAFT_183624 [Calocera viscosa TUFC12733]|uniref:Secreted protein n=1 Tax=Calocera viscosa (strain TUFC12733) TaxID=1330018 RepID=A0A167L2L0_CALVF|nr:hypothetical protein CALVIDRAFT_183624 [Calocera viscosa TUFC12733]
MTMLKTVYILTLLRSSACSGTVQTPSRSMRAVSRRCPDAVQVCSDPVQFLSRPVRTLFRRRSDAVQMPFSRSDAMLVLSRRCSGLFRRCSDGTVHALRDPCVMC